MSNLRHLSTLIVEIASAIAFHPLISLVKFQLQPWHENCLFNACNSLLLCNNDAGTIGGDECD